MRIAYHYYLNMEGKAKLDTVQKIASTLGETDKSPVATIGRLVKVMGEERALAVLDEALKIEAEGGTLTDDGSQRRTPGGVYFKLVKSQVTAKERQVIFGPAWAPAKKISPITWEECEQLSSEALKLPTGEARTVKVTIIGRPGRVIEKGNVIITSMKNTKPPALPKGLPKLPGDPTTYVVYIAAKQWSKVKESLHDNPDDKLIIEGYPVFDRRIGQNGAMTIFALNATSTLVQRAQRQTKKARSGR
jgi:hypothetical protein